ncbi:MAG: hypothetical protein V1673_02525 [Candidatus Omnitrophota bacterium]
MDKRKYVILGVGLVALTVIFSPALLRAATGTSDTTEGGLQNEPSTPLSRSIEAGKAVSKRALSSKAKAANAEAAKTEAAKPELTDFQKKIAAIAQGEASGKAVSATAPATKDVTPKGVVATKKAAEETSNSLVSKEAVIEPVKMIERKISGEVASTGPTGFSVSLGSDAKTGVESEMWFRYDKGLRLKGYKTVPEMQKKDRIGIVYGEAEDSSKRVVKEIALVQKGLKLTEEEQEMVVDPKKIRRSTSTGPGKAANS